MKTPSCGPLVYGGSGHPDYLIVSDLPLRAPPGAHRQVIGIEYVLRRRHYRAGRFRIGYQSCDDSTAATGAFDIARCVSNAKVWSADRAVLGVIGPYSSQCAGAQIPIANVAQPGPLAMVGTATTDPELTMRVPSGDVGTPGKYYPAGTRNFVRLTAPDEFQAAAAALLAQRHHLRRVFVLDDGDPYGLAVAGWFEAAAARLGLPVAGRAEWNPVATEYSRLAARVANAHPDGVFLSGFSFLHGTLVLKALRATLGPSPLIFAPDGFSDAAGVIRGAGAAALGLVTMFAGVPSRDAGSIGKEMLRRVGPEKFGQYGALYGATGAWLLLDAIARSDGTRASVTRALFRATAPRGIIGSFGFDRDGDPTVGGMTVFAIERDGPVIQPTLYPTIRLAKGR